MADEDDRQQSLPREPPQKLEELVRLLRCEHAGRLVEDQDVRVPVERLDDLDALLLTDGDVLHERIRVDRELEGLRELAHAPPRLAVIEKHARLRRLGRKHDVLGDGHDRDQHEVLVHHPDPPRDCVPRRVDPDGLALEEDPAVVRVVEAVEDVHQGRLPRAVLAQERVHLSLPEVEVDVVVRDDSREALGDAAELENRRFVGHAEVILGGGQRPPPRKRRPTSRGL